MEPPGRPLRKAAAPVEEAKLSKRIPSPRSRPSPPSPPPRLDIDGCAREQGCRMGRGGRGTGQTDRARRSAWPLKRDSRRPFRASPPALRLLKLSDRPFSPPTNHFPLT